MAITENWFKQDLKKPVIPRYITGNFFSLDNVGNLVGVKVYDNGAEVTLSGSVTGYCVLADGTTVPVAGTRSGNQAYILLPQSALSIPGYIGITLKLVDGSTITTLLSIIATVYQSQTDDVITPSQQVITDWSQQIAAALQEVEDASSAQDEKIDDLKRDLGDNAVDMGLYGAQNKFNPETVFRGYSIYSSGNLTENASYFTSDFIPCKGGQTFYYTRFNGTSFYDETHVNTSHFAQYDANKNFIANTRVQWANSIVLDSNCHYIRFSNPISQLDTANQIMSVTFDTIPTASTIEQYMGRTYVSEQRLIDDENRLEDVKGIADGLQIKINGYFGEGYLSSSEFVNGGWSRIRSYDSPGPTTNTIRIRCEKIVNLTTPIVIERLTDGFDYTYAVFDSNNVLISGSHDWLSENMMINSNDIKTLRIAIRKSNDAGIKPSDFTVMGIQVREINILDRIAESSTKLKVMTYNIGRFSYGSEPYYLDRDYEEKLANYKKFFSAEKCDLIGLQEQNKYIDGATSGSVLTNDAIFNYLYPYSSDTDNWTCIKSKYPLEGVGHGAFQASARVYAYATLNINGKSIFLLDVHTTPNPGASQEALREQEVQEIISLTAGKEYFIIFGDFNAQTTALFDAFIEEGFHVANGGYLPFEWTFSYDSADYTSDTPSTNIRYFDNIITSPNIIVDYSERKNVYTELSSDHIPFVAYLTVS